MADYNQQQNQSGQLDLGQLQYMTNDEREELAMKRYNAWVDEWKKEQQLRRKMRLVSAIVTSVLLASEQGVFDEPKDNRHNNNTNAQNNTGNASEPEATNQQKSPGKEEV
jgi:hypothetical protein